MEKKHLEYIDIAKGLGISLVVLGHSTNPSLMYFAKLFTVPLFFVLSGYTFRSINLQKKVKKLLKPYFFFNFLLVFLMFASRLKEVSWSHIGGIFYSRFALYPLSVDNNMIFLNMGNAPTWFFTAMFLSFVCLFFVLKTQKYRGLVIILYVVLTYLLKELPILLPWSLDEAFLFAIFIYGGIKLREKEWVHCSYKYVLLLFVVYYILYRFNGYCNASVRDYGRSIIVFLMGGFIGSYLVIRFSMILEKTCVRKILSIVGNNSLVIFCMQIPFLFIAEKLFSPIVTYFPNQIQMIVLPVIQTVFALGLGVFMSRLLNKYVPFLIK